jgi:spoIIIJ-associated protein
MSDTKTSFEKEIAIVLTDLLKALKIEAQVAVVQTDEGHYKADIQTQETGLLIGHHGEVINSLQLITGVILFKQLKTWVHVVLDVGGYRQMREENIKEMVNRIVAEVETTSQPVILPFLTPLERRIVHMMLTENTKVMSESSGEGRERRVTIKPRV